MATHAHAHEHGDSVFDHRHDYFDIGHPDSEGAEQRQSKVAFRLFGTLLGGALVANAYLCDWLLPESQGVGDLSAVIGALLLAAPLLWHAVHDLTRGELRMDELAALGILAAISLGQYRTAGVVAFLLLMSMLIQQRSALGARAAIEHLLRLTPATAQLLDESGSERTVEASALRAGQRIRVRPGDNIAADGIIRSGLTTINEATITGEALPADKQPGDQVFAGTSNLTGVIEVEVTRTGADTTLGHVRKLIADAERTRIPLMRIIDQHSQWYTPTMLMIVALIYFFTRDPNRAISALVLVCPCAFILATPTAMVAGLSAAARLGILIKNVQDLETAGRVNAVVFDKTGTLTTGDLVVTRLQPAPGVEPEELLLLAASVEHNSNHPVARAVVAVAREAKLALAEATAFEEVPGRGVRGNVRGASILVGRQTWLAEQGVDMSPLASPDLRPPDNLSVLFVARAGRAIGWVGLEDTPRPEAVQAFHDLRRQGIARLLILTGDKPAVASKVAAELGCTDFQAECLPQAKLQTVRQLRESGYFVAVVGDGVNDAPALAAGDVSVAMGAAGSDVAISSANIALMSNDLRRLPFLIRLSAKTRTLVLQNLVFGLVFMIGGLAFAGYGWMTPILAALLHNVSSFIVIFNSARLVRMGEEFTPHTANS
ncbi:MAG TPA: cation-translocating P-type ATPase [Planctomycetota bacterium]|nr:cation-translocating P-type ATPase [Planctomycetota bacterium]HRR81983.1 cation-translocating P-type ATPase [Planctomycetota bacterium]HRT97059.1 cation-translocating P-type ATPase [Planctomycetota bacterium]